ncbi:MAG: acyl-CoA reductase [Verrucomicrobiaceae bacterium]
MNHLPLIAQAAPLFAPYTGTFTEADLHAWLDRELPPLPNARYLIPENIVHLTSGNTPHAAYQTLLHGLLLGSKNRLKLPSNALPDFEASLAQLPPELLALIETSRTLPSHWLPEAHAIVAYGNDATLHQLRQQAPLDIPFIAHGHRLAIALIEDPTEEAAQLAARDICQFSQTGCLSLQTIYTSDPHHFAPLLAQAIEEHQKTTPPAPLSPSQHGAITNLRLETRYLHAQDPKNHHLWHSPADTAWTIIYQNTPALDPSPLGHTVFLKPLSQLPNLSPQDTRTLSQISLHPFTPRTDLPSHRIHPLGQAQSPPLAWAHDGSPPLRSLVKIQTVG